MTPSIKGQVIQEFQLRLSGGVAGRCVGERFTEKLVIPATHSDCWWRGRLVSVDVGFEIRKREQSKTKRSKREYSGVFEKAAVRLVRILEL